MARTYIDTMTSVYGNADDLVFVAESVNVNDLSDSEILAVTRERGIGETIVTLSESQIVRLAEIASYCDSDRRSLRLATRLDGTLLYKIHAGVWQILD